LLLLLRTPLLLAAAAAAEAEAPACFRSRSPRKALTSPSLIVAGLIAGDGEGCC